METNGNVKFALALLDIVNKKKEEIKTLTSEIIELEATALSMLWTFCFIFMIFLGSFFCSNSNSNDLQLVNLSAKIVFDEMRMFSDRSTRPIELRDWQVLISHRLEDFCTYANAWNPIEFDFNMRGWKVEFKNLNIGIIQNK